MNPASGVFWLGLVSMYRRQRDIGRQNHLVSVQVADLQRQRFPNQTYLHSELLSDSLVKNEHGKMYHHGMYELVTVQVADLQHYEPCARCVLVRDCFHVQTSKRYLQTEPPRVCPGG
jgi:hypothetical protein